MKEQNNDQIFDYPYLNFQALTNQKHKNKNFKQQASNFKITSTRSDFQLPNNKVHTSKYTFYNFLFKNLLEQFSKPPNIYFLVFGLMQMVSVISISAGIPTEYLPLSFIIIITAIKDIYEDYQRKKSDDQENNSKTLVYRNNKFEEILWKNIRVGDIIKIMNESYFPADIIILYTGEKNGSCFIETKNLDGETNMKQKFTQSSLFQYFTGNELSFHTNKLILEYELPNPIMQKFIGTATLQNGTKISLNINNLILRGCSLRNSSYVYGLVAYTGHNTKIMLNSSNARAKRSNLDVLTGNLVLWIFLIQMIFCSFAGFFYSIKYDLNQEKFNYLEIDKNQAEDHDFVYNLFVKIGNWVQVFGNFVPISLLVTLEFVKFFQAIYINSDQKMNFKSNNIVTETNVQSCNLNEELGQIGYIFSDKTGTLTQNLMEFTKITINGQTYGDQSDIQIKNSIKVSNVNFSDPSLFNIVKNPLDSNFQQVQQCLLMLALCHTILTFKKNEQIAYSASSPDELALVNFASFLGIKYLGKDEKDIITISEFDKKIYFQLIEIFEFNSDRKRQSVIVKDLQSSRIFLYSKGADNIMIKRLRKDQQDQVLELTKDNLLSYSLIGLRTLVLCCREIEDTYFNKWIQNYKKAKISMYDREEQMAILQDEIEQEMKLLGATAIEDCLQDQAGETICAFKEAGIKVWVLTGDKAETAINIGYSCQLLHNNQNIHVVDCQDKQTLIQLLNEIEKQIEETLINSLNNQNLSDIIKIPSQLNTFYQPPPNINANQFKIKTVTNNQSFKKDHALVITGDSLLFSNDESCRVTPKQKADLVKMIREKKPGISTLAVGDGANDVSMITAAHVGVGIKGVEGYQAARASDFSIGEFKILRRLLFYHGREAYRRNSRVVCYNFFKNILVVLPQFWYGFNNEFSGTTLYDPYLYQLFNVFFVSLPIIIYAIFDEDTPPELLVENKLNYYLPGIKNLLFNNIVFWTDFISSIWISLIISSFSIISLEVTSLNQNGLMGEYWATGSMMFGQIIVASNLKLMIISKDFSFGSSFIITLSLSLYILGLKILDNLSPSFSPMYNNLQIMLTSPYFHLGNILVIFSTSFIEYAQEMYEKFEVQKGLVTEYKNKHNQNK